MTFFRHEGRRDPSINKKLHKIRNKYQRSFYFRISHLFCKLLSFRISFGLYFLENYKYFNISLLQTIHDCFDEENLNLKGHKESPLLRLTYLIVIDAFRLL
jgi:hypothetical protein